MIFTPQGLDTVTGSDRGHQALKNAFSGSSSVFSKSSDIMKNSLSTISSVLGQDLSNLKKSFSTSAIKLEDNAVKDFQKWSEEQNNLAWQRSESSAQKQMHFQKAQSDLAWQRSESSAQKQMDFQRKMFEKSMNYNDRMSSTAYQRAVADLRKAGLNPVLAVSHSQGPASSPSVSAPSGSMASAQAMSGAMANSNTAQNVKGDYSSAKNADLNALQMVFGLFNSMVTSAVKALDAVVPF